MNFHFSLLACRLASTCAGYAVCILGDGTSLECFSRWRFRHIPLAEIAAEFEVAFLCACSAALGGLAFLNTWDFPIYVALFSGAYALGMLKQRNSVHLSLRDLIKDFFGMGLALLVTGIVLYLPFYFGFSSQAGGILPNLVYPTRGHTCG